MQMRGKDALSMLIRRCFHGLVAALTLPAVALTLPSDFARSEDFEYATAEAEECDDEDCGDSDCSYGPCPCKPRGTLFQWSYGTSFSGGPPGPDEPLVSDRPDFTEASVTVGRGVVQIESGYTYIEDESDGTTTRSHSFPETLVRVGVLADWLEFRVAWNYGAEEELQAVSPTFRTDGAEDLYLGFKIALTPQEGFLPEMALMPQMTIPTGAQAFTADQTLPGLNWLYGWDINDFLSTGGSSQYNMTLDPVTGQKYVEYAQSWTVGYSLTEKLGAYTEWFALFPSGADTVGPAHYADGGFTYQFTNNFQWDIRAGVGLNEEADDFFAGSGFVIRFP
jgi:hypothetical protein